MKKKIGSLLLALCLVLSLWAAPARALAAEEVPSVSASDVTVTAGSSVTAVIKANDFTDVAALDFSLHYDANVFEVTACSAGALLSGAAFDANFDTAGEVTVSAATANAVSGSGELARVTFRAKSGTAAGTYAVDLAVGDVYGADLQPVTVTGSGFRITVKEPAVSTQTFRVRSVTDATPRHQGDSFDVVFNADYVSNLGSLDLVADYDENLLALESFTISTKLTGAESAVYTVNTDTPGYVKASILTPYGVSDSFNPLVTMRFRALQNTDDSTLVMLQPQSVYDKDRSAMKTVSAAATVTLERVEEAPVLPVISLQVAENELHTALLCVEAQGETALAAGDFIVSYDASRLSCTAVTPGGTGMVVSNIKDGDGQVKFSFVCDGGISADTVLAQLAFTKKHIACAETDINLTGKNLVDDDLSSVSVTYTGASVETHEAGPEARLHEPQVCLVCGVILHEKFTPRIIEQPTECSTPMGETAHFTVAAEGDNLTYQWQYMVRDGTNWINSGMDGAQTATLSVAATAARDGQQYRCVVTDSVGDCVTSEPATLYVLIPLTFTLQPEDVSVWIGETARFEAAAQGNDVTYRWQSKAPNGNWLDCGTTAELSVEAAKSMDGWQYRCIITDRYGNAATSNAATLEVKTRLSITAHPEDVSVWIGETATFAVTAVGDDLTYRWQSKAPNGNWLDCGTSAELSVETAKSMDGWQYRCVVTDRYGNAATSNSATLEVKTRLSITAHPEDVSVWIGETATFQVTAEGDGLKYQWQYKLRGSSTWNDSGMDGAKTDTLQVKVTAARNGQQYRCVVTDRYGSTATSNAATLEVKTRLSITAHPEDVSVWIGETATFTVTAVGDDLTYRWQSKATNGNWVDCGTSAELSVEAAKSMDGWQYRCVVTDRYGNTATSNAATLEVKTRLAITAHPEDVSVWIGETATFAVTAVGDDVTYRWQSKAPNGNWVDCGTTAELSVEAAKSMDGWQYRCIITDRYGNTATSNAATLEVKTRLSITAHPEDVSVWIGETATFQVTAVGDDLTYRWQSKAPNGNWLDCGTSAELSVETAKSMDGWQYRCVVTDRYGSTATSNAATLEVKTRLSITAHPEDVSVWIGETASFTVTAVGDNVTYRWQSKAPNGNWLDCGTSAELSVETAKSMDGWQYRCVVTDRYGNTATSNAATLEVKTRLSITAHPEDVSVWIGETASFTVTAVGDDLTYRWQSKAPNGNWLDCGTTAELSVEAAKSMDGWQYRCIITDRYGNTATSNAATLEVKTRLSITAHPEDVSVWNGETASFAVTAVGDDLTYRWQSKAPNGNWVDCGTSAELSVETAKSMDGWQYRCIITDRYGNTATSNAATLEVKTRLSITAHPEDVSVWNGETASFAVTAVGDDLTYRWQSKAPNGNWVDCGTSAELSVETAKSMDGWQYRCIITDRYGNTATSNAATLEVKTRLSITSHPEDVSVWIGETASFAVTAVGDDLTYRWQSKAPNGNWVDCGTTAELSVEAAKSMDGWQYRCVVTDRYGNTATSNAATLEVKTRLSITAHPEDVSVWIGETASFTVTAVGDDLTYRWQSKAPNGNWLDCGTTAELSVEAAKSMDGWQYRCIITDRYGNTATSNAATLEVKTRLAITSHPEDVSVWIGETATFTVTAVGDGLKYQWQYKLRGSSTWNDSGMDGAKTDTLQVKVTAARNGQQYRCVITDRYGSTVTSEPATLTAVTKVLTITSQPKNAAGKVGETVHFTVSAEGDGLKYQWQYKLRGSSTWNDSGMDGAKTDTLQVKVTAARNGQQYRCVVTDRYGSTVTSEPATLTAVTKVLTITSQPKNAAGKVGETVHFTVSAEGDGLKYQWQYKLRGSSTWNDSGMDGAKTDTLQVKVTAARNGQQYRCVVTDRYGSTVTSEPATLTAVTKVLTITSQPKNAAGKVGETVHFTVSAEGDGLKYQWQYKLRGSSTWNDSGMDGAKTDTLQVKVTAARNGQQYRCVVTDRYGSTVTSEPATLTAVTKVLTITSQPKNAAGKVGETVHFTVSAEGDGLKYQWQYKLRGSSTWNDSGMDGAKTDTLQVKVTAARNGQQYRCVVTDRYGSTVTSEPATLTAVTKVLTITSQPKNAAGKVGDTVHFTVSAEGDGLKYQWQYKLRGSSTWNDSGMDGAKTDTLQVKVTAARNGQQYRCVITDRYGSTVTSEPATLTAV